MILPKVVIGTQWGDEGKGKIVDFLAKNADFVVRFNGGNNAGHSVVYKNRKYPLSLLPSGVLQNKKLLIAQGVVVNPKVLLSEIDFFTKEGYKPRLIVDGRTNIVMPYHQMLDDVTEIAKGEKKVGSLKLGIGYCYEDRNNRHGIRLEDLIKPSSFKEKLAEEFILKKKRLKGVYNYKVNMTLEEIFTEYLKYGEKLKGYIGDVSLKVSQNLGKKNILFEGAHGTFLDGNFGTYPFTTAVNTISGSVFSYVGFPPQKLNVVGVVKAYTTRVGGGPFPTELFDGIGTSLQEKGEEFGTVSRRKRRCGWLDFSMLRLAKRLNGFNCLALTKLDVLSDLREIKICHYYNLNGRKIEEFPSSLDEIAEVQPVYKTYKGWMQNISNIRHFCELPKSCQKYVKVIEEELEIPVFYISVAAERNALIKK